MQQAPTGRTPRTWRSDAAEDVQEVLPLALHLELLRC